MVKVLPSVVLLALSVICAGAADVNNDWWKTAIFYQIYPRSFMDSDGDGIGDLNGITSKLQYLKDLGITAAWLSPIFKSPQRDMGYDISDYRAIHEEYGTMKDFEDLLAKAKELGLKIILDFVPNHTSDQHEWFIESSKSNATYEDYYIWREGSGDDKKSNPNNWISIFEGTPWTLNEDKGKFYLHQFSSYQPDLNYRNPNLQKEMLDILTFWLDKGVAGFRVDAVPYLVEDSDFKDEPKLNDDGNYASLNHVYTKDLQGTFDTIYSWRKHVDEYSAAQGGDARVLMTEAYTTFDNTLLYYGTENGSILGAHFTFNFDFITALNNVSTAQEIKSVIDNWLTNLPDYYTHNWVLGNHDQHRVATRFGTEHIDALNMLVAILPGIQVTYNGEEFGMENGQVSCEQSHDPSANCDNDYDNISRDFERTPMQWDDSANAGFSTNSSTWLPVSDKYKTCNVKQQLAADRSYLKNYETLPIWRKKLQGVKNTEVTVKGDVLIVSRVDEDEDCNTHFYLYNRLGDDVEVEIPATNKDINLKVVTSSENSDKKIGTKLDPSEKLKLKTNEALVLQYDCDKPSSANVQNLMQFLLWCASFIVLRFN